MAKDLQARNWPQAKIDFFEKFMIKPVRPMRIPRKLIEKKVAFYIKHKIPYWLENTNERTTVYASGNWGAHMNKESTFKANELQFIKKVKEYITKNETYLLLKNNFKHEKSLSKIKYAIYTKKTQPGTVFTNCHEIDLKGAYWEQLHMLHPDLLSHEIYLQGLTVDKKTRLASVGTLAKKTGCISFDGQKESLEDPIKSNLTEFIWNTISYKIGKVMAQASKSAKADFLFFWVDAIFVKGEKTQEIVDLFERNGFKSSVHLCESIRFDETKIIVTSKEKGKWVVKKTREKIILPNGKSATKITKKRVYTEERPFPFKKLISKAI